MAAKVQSNILSRDIFSRNFENSYKFCELGTFFQTKVILFVAYTYGKRDFVGDFVGGKFDDFIKELGPSKRSRQIMSPWGAFPAM